MKNTIRLALIGILCLASVSCTKMPATTSAVELTLALRAGIYADVIKSCLPAFEKAHNVRCTVLELSEDALHASIIGEAQKAEGNIDFCMVDGSWMAECTAKKVLANLSALGYQLDDDIIPATTAICYNNDSLYLAPYYGNVTVMLYNRLVLKDVGYTADAVNAVDDIVQICLEAKKHHTLGFLYRGDTENNIVVDFLPFLCSYGGWVVDKDNKPTVNTPAFYNAMNTYLTLIQTGRSAKKDDLITAIANRSAAVAVGWPGWYTPERNSTMDYFALSGKATNDAPAYNANVYGIWTIGIPANSAHTTLATELLAYLMEPERQKQTVAYGGVPCRYSSLQDAAVLKKFPQYAVICKALESGIYRPVLETWPEFYTILGSEMKAIIDGKKSIHIGLTDAQTRLEAQLAVQ